MVLFFTSTAVSPPAVIYMGRDKVENEDLIKYGLLTDVWFHVDKLSSAHVYLRLPPNLPYGDWEHLPPALLADCAQLVKANSIEGNKKDNLKIIYTPWDNLLKSGAHDVGQVSFKNDKRVRREYVATRDNAIVNRLNKTKKERAVDHEQERVDRIKEENRVKRLAANDKKNQDLEEKRRREEEKKGRSYDQLFTEENGYGVDKDAGGDGGGSDDDDDFW